MADCKLIAYYRVSTDRQGKSGLGIEAQKSAVAKHRDATGCEIVAEYVEVESGKRNDRPELDKAIAHAKRVGATLVFAKLDRLARNARFLLGLVESGAEMVFCDIPQVPPGPLGKFMLTQMAAVAELEAGLIGQRTRDALKEAKARGVKLGGHRGKLAAQRAAEAKASNANAFADSLRDSIAAIRAEGVISASGIAKALNARKVRTVSGGEWQTVQVQRLLARLEGQA
jgi:DNA invertase Pin-like site-specific DNA recombinase